MEFPVDRPSARLGRGSANEIVLEDTQASRQHAEISRQGDQFFVQDLGSTNGTFVNGQRLAPNVPFMLHPGDQVQLADTVLTFEQAYAVEDASSAGLPRFESTGVTRRRRLRPAIVALVVVAVLLWLALLALVGVLLLPGKEPAVIVSPPSPTAPAVAAATTAPTTAPTATPTPSILSLASLGTDEVSGLTTSVPPTAMIQASPLPTVDVRVPTAPAQATAPSSALSKELLTWLKGAEGKLFVAGELILKFRTGVSDQEAQAFLKEQGLQSKAEIAALGLRLVTVKDGSAADALSRLEGNPLLSFVEPNALAVALNEPNDALWSRQWNMRIIQAPQGWDLSTGSGDVVVAILDSGIDLTHPDLRDRIVAGYDFVENDASPQDEFGHGTHVAGIAAAIGNNGEGVAGVSWGARIMPVRVLGPEGEGNVFGIVQGIVWAADKGARVENMSLGSPFLAMLADRGVQGGAAMQAAIDYAHSHNVLVVVAAGNEYDKGNMPSYPAAFPHVLAVAATNDQDRHSYYSSAGTYVDIAAPGGEASEPDDPHGVISTLPNYEVGITREGYPTGYGAAQGTSMAAPHVTGLAALIWSVNPDLSNDQVQAIIEASADDLGRPGWDGCFGAGRINVDRALKATSDGRIPASGPREHKQVLPSFCPDFTTLPEATFPIPAPTINWSWTP
jgi:subtilisin family serine protease